MIAMRPDFMDPTLARSRAPFTTFNGGREKCRVAAFVHTHLDL